MSWEQAVEALNELKRLGCRFVIFEGGEPLLWSDGNHDFSDLPEKARSLFLRVGVTTNGTVSLDVPTDLLWVSLDGAFDRALHHTSTPTTRGSSIWRLTRLNENEQSGPS